MVQHAEDGALKMLRKMYLVVHPLYWIDRPPGTEATEQEEQWLRHFPDRWELSYELEIRLQERYRRLVGQAKEDEGMFFLPTMGQACCELLELAREHFGPRMVALEDKEGYKFDRDMPHIRKLLGQERAEALEASLQEDRRQATANRGPDWEEGLEWACWEWSKTWVWYLNRTLEERGYTYDPATVEFEALGENWSGCAATYPINMGRAMGLANPVARRFDLINADYTPILLKATLVDQNLPMPGNVRLFIFKTANEGPTWGRYIAQYFEGVHGVIDPQRVVEVDFPPNSITEITSFGWSKERSLGIWPRNYGRIEMSVGYGGHFHHPSTRVIVQPPRPEHDLAGLSLDDFRAALLAGKVKELPGADGPSSGT